MKKTKIKTGKYAIEFEGRKFFVTNLSGIGWVLENDKFETCKEKTFASAIANIRNKWSKLTGKI